MEKLFTQILINYQKKINKEIKRFFDKKISQTNLPFLKKTLKILKEFSLRPAKRTRAILVNYGYFLAGGKEKRKILKTSIFIELVHNYLIIHDDIIDRDKIRRGGKALHYQYQKTPYLDKKEKEHYGQSIAMVAGDLMASLGYGILTFAKFPNNFKIQALAKLNQIIHSTCYGQMFELRLRERIKFNKKIGENEIFEIYRNKSAQYSFVGPLQIGATLAGADQKFLKKIEEFALPLGIAFQIQDDILDVKSDSRENQPTLIRKSNSLQYCQNTVKKLINQSKEILNRKRDFPKKEKQFLFDLINYVATKNS